MRNDLQYLPRTDYFLTSAEIARHKEIIRNLRNARGPTVYQSIRSSWYVICSM